jgi:hypothetical protein
VAEIQEKIKRCFVVGPIGEPDSETRIHADWLLEEIIQPVLVELGGFEIMRADQIAQPGMIDAQIIRQLTEAELVIADLSTLNPNAFYEIGIRHMAQKPIIHIQLIEDKIPFDVSLYRAIKFARTRPSDLRRAREELKRAVSAVFAEGYQVDNPVTRARGQIKLEEGATPEQKLILDQISELQDRLNALEGTGASALEIAEGMVNDRARRLSRHSRPVELYVLFDSNYEHTETTRKQVVEHLNQFSGIVRIFNHDEWISFQVQNKVYGSPPWKRFAASLLAIPGVAEVTDIPF